MNSAGRGPKDGFSRQQNSPSEKAPNETMMDFVEPSLYHSLRPDLDKRGFQRACHVATSLHGAETGIRHHFDVIILHS